MITRGHSARGPAARGASALLSSASSFALLLVVLGSTAGCRNIAGANLSGPFDRALTLGGKPVAAERLNHGFAAYTHYCRPCHGTSGDGAGPSAAGLRPPPRDLRLGVYKFASVPAGQLPTDDDFRRIIRKGLHGTAMLAWDLPPAELDDVIEYIKTFAPRWQTEQPGEPIAFATNPWESRPADGVERGRRVYHGMAQCAVACHPAYATRAEITQFARELAGLSVTEFRSDLYDPVPKPSDYGVSLVPPDFTFHVLRSGETLPDIYRVIAAGVGGTAMPTWKNVLPDADLWAMAHYVGSLVTIRGTTAADELRARLRAPQ